MFRIALATLALFAAVAHAEESENQEVAQIEDSEEVVIYSDEESSEELALGEGVCEDSINDEDNIVSDEE